MLTNTRSSYGSVAKFFHWTVALLIIGMLIFGYLMVGLTALTVHKFIGLAILTLATFRLLWMLFNPHPQLPAGNPLLDTIAARGAQALLYVCMFGMPLSGWAMATGFGVPPHIGTLTLAMPGINIDHSIGSLFETIHNTLAIGLIVILCLHVLGALKHYFIDKDNVLQKMLP